MRDLSPINILSRWPDRASIHADVLTVDQKIQMVAVHRWFSRNSIPSKFWLALVEGAAKRGFKVTPEELAGAHDGRRRCKAA
ncbi:hypothetical protein [Sagittula stellata]|uniref:hypothetical protein n=1 Tax=Sagittula stellata TaxID=52603 RepID=UPI0018DB8BF3|nr:hypothetical protein [Sagittula stellata]